MKDVVRPRVAALAPNRPGRIVLLIAVILAIPASAETPPEFAAPQRLQLGFFGDYGIDDGDHDLYAAGNVDWVIWRRFFAHYGLGFESRLNSFLRMRNAIGVGYLVQTGRSSVPVWLAAGITTTGLWSHYLNREFVSVGAGYRYHIHPELGAGINAESAFFRDGVSEQRFSIGLVYARRAR